jgi:hypothetical protein
MNYIEAVKRHNTENEKDELHRSPPQKKPKKTPKKLKTL